MITRHQIRQCVNAYPAVAAALLPTVLLMVLAQLWDMQDRVRMLQRLLQFSPAPVLLFFWLNAIKDDYPALFRKPNWLMLGICLGAFANAAGLWGPQTRPWWTASMIMVGLAGYAFTVDIRTALTAFVTRPKMSFVLLAGSFSCKAYFVAQALLWEKMCHATAYVIFFFFKYLTTKQVWINEQIYHQYRRLNLGNGESHAVPVEDYYRVLVGSNNFTLNLYPPCSGLEGVALFFFLLSIMLLVDWKMFNRFRIIDLYLVAFLYMFCMNVLRIILFFLVGDWAYAPRATAFAQSFQEAPLMLFHTWVGWVTYLVAFGLFLVAMYKIARKKT